MTTIFTLILEFSTTHLVRNSFTLGCKEGSESKIDNANLKSMNSFPKSTNQERKHQNPTCKPLTKVDAIDL